MKSNEHVSKSARVVERRLLPRQKGNGSEQHENGHSSTHRATASHRQKNVVTAVTNCCCCCCRCGCFFLLLHLHLHLCLLLRSPLPVNQKLRTHFVSLCFFICSVLVRHRKLQSIKASCSCRLNVGSLAMCRGKPPAVCSQRYQSSSPSSESVAP